MPIPDAKNHMETPNHSATGLDIKSPTGIVMDIRVPIKENALPWASGGITGSIHWILPVYRLELTVG